MQGPSLSPPSTESGTEELPLFVWATRLVRRADGRAELIAVKPQKDLSVREAAEVLGVQPGTVRRLWRYGLLTGGKPGAVAVRSDGRASNAALVLDAESVLRYKAQTQRVAVR